MSEWSADHIKELIRVEICAERRLRDALRAEDRRHFENALAALDKALQHQAVEYERRLTDLNHSHAQAKDALATYIPREIYEKSHSEVRDWERKSDLRFVEIEQRLKANEMGLVNLPGGIKSLELGLASQTARKEGSDFTSRSTITLISVIVGVIVMVIAAMSYLASK